MVFRALTNNKITSLSTGAFPSDAFISQLMLADNKISFIEPDALGNAQSMFEDIYTPTGSH